MKLIFRLVRKSGDTWVRVSYDTPVSNSDLSDFILYNPQAEVVRNVFQKSELTFKFSKDTSIDNIDNLIKLL